MQKLKHGEIVNMRRRRWRIVDVRAYERCSLVTLAGAEPRSIGVTRRVLAPFDILERRAPCMRLHRIGIRSWRRRCRVLLADAAPPGCLRSARRAQIDLLPHQLEPALAVIRGLGTRLLLADEVGLGKTVQAALVVSELRARGAADRVLVLTPAGLREQWASELRMRLQIEATVVDMAGLRRLAAALPLDVNPWQTVPTAIASIDYVKRPDVLRAVSACHWDVLIVDEAHGVAMDTDRHAAAAALALGAPYVLLLTATPHSGDRRSFVSLCNLGALDGDRALLFRRTRNDVRAGTARRVHHLHVRSSAAETRMHMLLAKFINSVRRERGDAVTLAASVLQKRALSSAQSLERSVARRLATLDAGVRAHAFQIALPLADPAGELTSADDVPEWSDELTLADASRERRLLLELASVARRASLRETKVAALKRLIRRAAEPIVIFTEYRDTLLHLRAALPCATAVLHGGLNRDERSAALNAFTTGVVSVLLATDAAAEGLNLHHGCRLVVNLELPWNPMRLEQRIGRVDRIGQRRTVHAVHFIARDTAESAILARLRDRISSARRDIGSPDPVGGNNESSLARLVTGGSDAHEQSVDGGAPPLLTTPDLALDAECEAARLHAGRARANEDDGRHGTLVGGPTCIARARRTSARAALGGRIVLIFQAALENALGRVAETTLVPVMLSSRRHLSDREIGIVARTGQIATHVERAICGWRANAEATHRAFLAMRLARAKAIQSALPTSTALSQPGLFDRRADTERESASREERSHSEEHRRRVEVIERQTVCVHQEAELLLVLKP